MPPMPIPDTVPILARHIQGHLTYVPLPELLRSTEPIGRGVALLLITQFPYATDLKHPPDASRLQKRTRSAIL